MHCNSNFRPTPRVTVDGCAFPQISGCGQLERAAARFYDELLMLTRSTRAIPLGVIATTPLLFHV
jgi:hypothetical protein